MLLQHDESIRLTSQLSRRVIQYCSMSQTFFIISTLPLLSPLQSQTARHFRHTLKPKSHSMNQQYILSNGCFGKTSLDSKATKRAHISKSLSRILDTLPDCGHHLRVVHPVIKGCGEG